MLKKLIENIQATEEAARQAKTELSEYAKKNILTQEEVDFFYWNTDYPTNLITQLKGTKEVKISPTPLDMEVRCCDCKHLLRTPYKCKSRVKRDEILKGQGYIKCDLCEADHERRMKAASESLSRDYESKQNKKRQKELDKTSDAELLKAMPYKEYLQTYHWQSFRRRALKRCDYKCQLCNRNGELHVHHRTYENRGNESYKDVIVLCKTCHAKHHNKVQVERG